MASVTSLDKDLRSLRLDKYTPRLANETREWLEEVLGEQLKPGDLLEALKDGTALCKLINLAIGPPGVRFKQSSMPFVQMENISHFLRVCQVPPLNLQPHEVFLTVDLYEHKDPAQVLHCIGAFSRRASALRPEKFSNAIGRGKGGLMSPQSTGTSNGGYSSAAEVNYQRGRGASGNSETSTSSYNPQSRGRGAPGKNGESTSPKGVSSWSRKMDEGATTPAWNIHQYGYMGGASQGNQGITFGGRRQITSPAPKVPTLAEKERKRKDAAEAEAENLKVLAEEAERKRRIEREAEQERERIVEEDLKIQRERERKEAEEEKRKWDTEEKRWKDEEEMRLREEKEIEARLESEKRKIKMGSDARLNGQFLSQYQAGQKSSPAFMPTDDPVRIADREHMKDLERQLEEARERERQYESERRERFGLDGAHTSNAHQGQRPPAPSDSWPQPSSSAHSHQNGQSSPLVNERDDLRPEPTSHQHKTSSPLSPPHPRPLPIPQSHPVTTSESSPSSPPSPHFTPPPPSSRPLPDPTQYTSTTRAIPSPAPTPAPTPASALNPASPPPIIITLAPPPSHHPTTHIPPEASHTTTAEHDAETARRLASSQATTKAGGRASKSLLEREMECERQRQQEWEDAQRATKAAAAVPGVKEGGSGPGESWDVNQYGYMGGDSQNRGGVVFGARRQIIGPRPKP